MDIRIDGFYARDVKDEHFFVGIPFEKGYYVPGSASALLDGDEALPVQSRILSRYDDGSARFILLRFMADVAGRSKKTLRFERIAEGASEGALGNAFEGIRFEEREGGFHVDTGAVSFTTATGDSLFEEISYQGRTWRRNDITGILLSDEDGSYEMKALSWEVLEAGPLCLRLLCRGEYGRTSDGRKARFEVRLTALYKKSGFETSFRLINADDRDLKVSSMAFCLGWGEGEKDFSLRADSDKGLGFKGSSPTGGEAHGSEALGLTQMREIVDHYPVGKGRYTTGVSNYRTQFSFACAEGSVCRAVDDKTIMAEGNEHFVEVFYGTLFADRTDGECGVCATVFKAHQNYPKAVKADASGLYVMLVPEGYSVTMPSGTSREQSFWLSFHPSETDMAEIDDESLRYQMPLRAQVDPEVFAASKAVYDVFGTSRDMRFESAIIELADEHSRTMGMMGFGDAMDGHYTSQGRGGGEPVWINNEYDYAHACAQQYMRTGIRRYMDYAIVHAYHQMDVDICHYSSDPHMVGGQFQHSAGHVRDRIQAPSHQWCEGLLDCYHLTGDERALESAIGIGRNVLHLLELPGYQKPGEATARETGWALRVFVALYQETGETRWKKAASGIVSHFYRWQKDYGCWVSDYTDNVLVRVSFMISVAVGSLMRYYRLFPDDELRALILSAVDDIYDNCRTGTGYFIYKTLPSLERIGLNPLLLEAMATGWELTGDRKYLDAGIMTFEANLAGASGAASGAKKTVGENVMLGTRSIKGFAQGFYPLVYFKKCLDLVETEKGNGQET